MALTNPLIGNYPQSDPQHLAVPPPNYQSIAAPPPNYQSIAAPPPNYQSIAAIPSPNYQSIAAPPPNYQSIAATPTPNNQTIAALPPNYQSIVPQQPVPPANVAVSQLAKGQLRLLGLICVRPCLITLINHFPRSHDSNCNNYEMHLIASTTNVGMG